MNDLTLLTIGVVIGWLVYAGGVVSGYYMYRSSHNNGVKLVDRIKQDMSPFDEDSGEERVQLRTGGPFESVDTL